MFGVDEREMVRLLSILQVVGGLVLTFLAVQGYVRLVEINSVEFQTEVAPFCDPNLPHGVGYDCDVDALMEYQREKEFVDSINFTFNDTNVSDGGLQWDLE